MSNMPHCRMINTWNDLLICESVFEKLMSGDATFDDALSDAELNASIQLVETCRRITNLVNVPGQSISETLREENLKASELVE